MNKIFKSREYQQQNDFEALTEKKNSDSQVYRAQGL